MLDAPSGPAGAPAVAGSPAPGLVEYATTAAAPPSRSASVTQTSHGWRPACCEASRAAECRGPAFETGGGAGFFVVDARALGDATPAPEAPDCAPLATCDPHAVQNRSPAFVFSPQELQKRVRTGVPHCEQKAPSVVAPHAGHSTELPVSASFDPSALLSSSDKAYLRPVESASQSRGQVATV